MSEKRRNYIQTTVVLSRGMLARFDRRMRQSGFFRRPPYFLYLIRVAAEGHMNGKIPTLIDLPRRGGVRVPVRISKLMLPLLDAAVERSGHTMRTKFLAGLVEAVTKEKGTSNE